MLDDINYLNNLDPSDMLGFAGASATQLSYNYDVDLSSLKNTTFANVLFAGMGGSALSALIYQGWRGGTNLPFEVVRDYDIPLWVGSNTLAIISSFSGNTEETVEAYQQAIESGAKVVVFTDGGKLQELAEVDGVVMYKIPDAIQPRMAAYYSLRALAELLDGLNIEEGMVAELETAGPKLEAAMPQWAKDAPEEHNYAKQLASYSMGKNIEVHGGPIMGASAYKWKISFNETSKNIAFSANWPEFNHNEFIGWSSHPIERNFAVFILVSSFESARIRQRYDISVRLLSGKLPDPRIIDCVGDSVIEQMLWVISLGDHVSTYLSILNGNNPAPVELIEKLKGELNAPTE